MVKKLDFYQSKAVEVFESDIEKQRLNMMYAMDDMYYGRFKLPEDIRKLDWIVKAVSSDPYDAVRKSREILSAVQPRIKLQPLSPDRETRQRTDRIERWLKWHFRNAGRRQRADVLRDLVLSALLYDEVIAQVVYLPHQIKELKSFKGQTERLEAAKRYGPYSIIVRNPQQVHVKYSDWMAEEIFMRRTIPLHKALHFWGDKAKKLEKMSKTKDAKDMNMVTIFEYQDMVDHAVWGVLHESGKLQSEVAAADGMELIREEHEIGFLPWVAKAGGSNLAEGEERQPILYPLYKTGSWHLQNIIETLLTSEVIANASAPRLKVEGPTDNVEVDYGEPGRPAYVPPGHSLTEMQPPVIDMGLAVIADRIDGRIGKSTIPKVIFGDIPQGAAFAAINSATQAGLNTLTPAKNLVEQVLIDIFSQMLFWVDKEGGKDSIAFPSRKKTSKRADCLNCGAQDVQPNFDNVRVANLQDAQMAAQFANGDCPECGAPLGRGKIETEEVMEQVIIDPNDFDANNLHMEVELTADVPTDRMQRINASALAKRELGLSAASGLESIGVTDVAQERETAEGERREEFEEGLSYEIEKLERLGAVQLKQQQQAMQMQMEMQMQMQQQQVAAQAKAAQNAEGGGANGAGGNLVNDPRVQGAFNKQRNVPRKNIGGDGFDTNLQGDSASTGDPGATREIVTGRDRQGAELAGR